MTDAYKTTPRTRLRRLPKRAHYDRATVHAILDAGFVCHVGYAIDGQPYVTPTTYWRHEDRVYWHGSSASRMLRNIAAGVTVCFTVTHIDGFVMARSGFHHSVNYRSVMALGTAHAVTDAEEKERALDAFVERLFPGRVGELRPATRQELKGTMVVGMELVEVSAKVRTGPPVDDEADYALPVWAGVLPIRTTFGPPEADPLLTPGIPLPGYLDDFALDRP
ncbi:flavin-nucleotide-binding protein [Allostella sp. ATCC 35155]|nr:flavin-nucleotide-binding protein [Stella sp. ATCC 35155]